jgi:hypothetical protein
MDSSNARSSKASEGSESKNKLNTPKVFPWYFRGIKIVPTLAKRFFLLFVLVSRDIYIVIGIKVKFYLYLLVTTTLSTLLWHSMLSVYQSSNIIDMGFALLILLIYLGLYLSIRKVFLSDFFLSTLFDIHYLTKKWTNQ